MPSSRSLSPVLPASRGPASVVARLVPACLLLGALAGGAPAPATAITLLHATFDDKVIDEPLGTAGPAAGEPVDLGELPAMVRPAPFATNCVELTEDWGFGARHLRFEFLGGSTVDRGTLDVTFRLWIPAFNNFTLYLRERGSSAVSFFNLRLDDSGFVMVGDLDSPGYNPVGGYVTGEPLAFALHFDLAADSYTLTLNGETRVADGHLGPLPQGIGAFLVGLDHDSDAAGTCFLDDLEVTASEVAEPVAVTTWGGIKGLYRGR